MSGFVVEVQLEDHDDAGPVTLLYGPFRSRPRALRVAARMGKHAGLNLNNFGGWAGTDGGDKFAFIYVREVWDPNTNRLNDAIMRVLSFFLSDNDEEEPEDDHTA